ncbi:MAG: malectin, partial [Planctomycetes bacterium]|nr:malectin [Planctomycetota bacterium]
YSLRAGTPAVYDLRSESGTIPTSGPRSGCTNSVIPAGGLLNIPYFYEGCTCSYPLPVGLALVNMPQEHEQWASWGASKPRDIIRIGINLGAPGDRVDSNGTLWLDEPSVGGPSPAISVSITPPETRYRYRHSLWITGGRGWPWVCASGASALSPLTLKGLRKGRFPLRLYFAELEDWKAGERVFDVFAEDKKLLDSFDIAAQAGSPLRGVVKEFPGRSVDGTLDLRFSARRGRTLRCGIELIADHLEPGKIFSLERKKAGHRLIRAGKR